MESCPPGSHALGMANGYDPRLSLSADFTLGEFCHSDVAVRRGISVEILPGTPEEQAVRVLVARVLQPLRDAVGPIRITSGYRPPWLNRLVCGSPRSQHMKAEAADFVSDSLSARELAQKILDLGLPFDQLIFEFGRWVHCSIAVGRAWRGEVLTASLVGGRPRYTRGLEDT